MRPCLQCGTPTTHTRCPLCERERQRTRNQARRGRYGRHHQTLRHQWAERIATHLIGCSRCDTPIHPDQPWDLDHVDGTHCWPAHAHCNRSAGGQHQQP